MLTYFFSSILRRHFAEQNGKINKKLAQTQLLSHLADTFFMQWILSLVADGIR